MFVKLSLDGQLIEKTGEGLYATTFSDKDIYIVATVASPFPGVRTSQNLVEA